MLSLAVNQYFPPDTSTWMKFAAAGADLLATVSTVSFIAAFYFGKIEMMGFAMVCGGAGAFMAFPIVAFGAVIALCRAAGQ